MKEIWNTLINRIINSMTVDCAVKNIFLEADYNIKTLTRVRNAATELRT
jgi:hypothetical protein